jgi:hypothetical protein
MLGSGAHEVDDSQTAQLSVRLVVRSTTAPPPG